MASVQGGEADRQTGERHGLQTIQHGGGILSYRSVEGELALQSNFQGVKSTGREGQERHSSAAQHRKVSEVARPANLAVVARALQLARRGG